MKILITGARGMVGSAVCEAFKYHDLITPAKHELNSTRLSQVMKFKCDLIIHLAAETDHEYCDENPAQCYFVNTIGVGNMTRLAKTLDIPIVYLSAASVFDGKKETPYEPLDIPNPVNHYNMSKYYGEIIVAQHPKHYIFRAGWMFGGGRSLDKKFVNKLIKKIDGGQKRIEVCDDCIGSPTYSKDLAEYIKWAVENKYPYGIINSANENFGVSRFDFALEVVKILNVEAEIVPVKIDDLKEEFPCKRTNYEVVANNGFMRNWKSALKEYIDACYEY